MWELFLFGSGWIFWAILGIAFFIEFISVGHEKVWPTVIVPVVFLAIVSLFTTFNPFIFTKDNWKMMGIYLLGYFGVACLFAFFKWWRRSIRRGRIYAKCLEDWAEEFMPDDVVITSVNDIPMDKRMAFFHALKNAFYEDSNSDENYGRERWKIHELDSDPYYEPPVHRIRNEESTPVEKQEKQKKIEKHILAAQKQVLKKVLSSPKEAADRITVWMVAWPICILTTLAYDFFYDFCGWLRKSLTGVFVEISRMGMGKYRKDFDSIKVEKEI